MNSTSYPFAGWSRTTVPRSPRLRPCSGKSSVNTTVSSSLVIACSFERISRDEAWCVLVALQEPHRTNPRRSAERRLYCTFHDVPRAEGGALHFGELRRNSRSASAVRRDHQ